MKHIRKKYKKKKEKKKKKKHIFSEENMQNKKNEKMKERSPQVGLFRNNPCPPRPKKSNFHKRTFSLFTIGTSRRFFQFGLKKRKKEKENEKKTAKKMKKMKNIGNMRKV